MEFLRYELKVIENLVLGEKSKEEPPKYETRKGNRDKEKPYVRVTMQILLQINVSFVIRMTMFQ